MEAGQLKVLMEHHPGYAGAYLFLGDIYESQGKLDEAKAAYRKALPSQDLPKASRLSLEARLQRLSPVKAAK
jgi:Tfp pilus assembly protein PilF